MRFNAYDARGKLLLCSGQVIASDALRDLLLQHGMFYGSEEECRGPLPLEPLEPQPSPLARVLGARRSLHALLSDPAPADFPAALADIAIQVRVACEVNPEVALASALLCVKGPYSSRHAVNVAIACQITGMALEFDAGELASTVRAALTMNIGMSALQDELAAHKGSLTAAQKAAVRGHCELGVARLRELGIDDATWLDAVRDHHERGDGSGYPAGKHGAEIGQAARLLAMADVYCARIVGRDHRSPLQPKQALRWLFLNENAVLDEQLARVFIKTLGVYPPGTGVRLRNGSVAIVVQRGNAGHQPVVASLTTPEGLRLASPIRRSGDAESHGIVEVANLWNLNLDVSMEALWGADAAD
nr:HD domain-containing phosphohydrolase [Rhodanobacter sp. DHB23]